MIAALVIALGIALGNEAPATGAEGTRFGVSLSAGVGLGMRRPLLPESLVSTRVRPSAALSLGAAPWRERPVGHGLAVRVPISYATTLGATALEHGPGLERTRRLRSQRLGLAVDVLVAVPGRCRGWLGGGLSGGYTTLDLASPRGLPVGHGLGLAALRMPMMLALASGRVWIGTTPAIGVALGDSRVMAMGPSRAGLALAASSWLRVRLVGRLDLAIHHEEQHARFPVTHGTYNDHWRTLTAGLVLTAGSPPYHADRARRAVASPPATDVRPAPAPTADRPLAPPLVGITLAGEPIDLASLRGRVVIVDFWASWCAPCREAMPRLQALHDELGPTGVVVIGVSVDESEADARAFLEAEGISFATVHDGEQRLAEAWQPTKMPTTFVLDRRGAIAAIHAGYTAAQGEALRTEVERLATEAP